MKRGFYLLILFLILFVYGCTYYPTGRTTQAGVLTVITTPSGVSVYLDDVYKGSTVVQEEGADNGVLTIDDLVDGTYDIRLVKNSYQEKEVSVNVVGAGSSVIETLELLPTGTLKVTSNPKGADVYADYALKGTTPITVGTSYLDVSLPSGTHSITVKKIGYQDYTTDVNIVENEEIVLDTVLTQLPTSTLKVTSTLKGASVSVGGNFKGVVPQTDFLIISMPSGQYDVLVSKKMFNVRTKGYKYIKVEKTVDVIDGQITTLSCTAVECTIS